MRASLAHQGRGRHRAVSLVVGERVVDSPQAAARCGRVELAFRGEVAPEDERVPAVLVRARIEQIARLDDWRASPSE
jgi:hypothetical protein